MLTKGKNTMKKNESGRSMVEMLGVLAIIGVLSIGGIAGYTLAMNRYRANEILDTASKIAVIAMSSNAGKGAAANLATTGLTATGVEDISATADGSVTIKGGAPEILNLIKELSGNKIGDKAITFSAASGS